MNADLVPDPKAAIAFLELLHPGGPWILTAIAPDGPTTTETFYQAHAVTAWITRQNPNRNIYWMPAEATGTLRKKATKDDVARTHPLWADIDGVADLRPIERTSAAADDDRRKWRRVQPLLGTGRADRRQGRDRGPQPLAREATRRRCSAGIAIGSCACPARSTGRARKRRSNGRVPVLARCIEHHPDRIYDFDDFGRIEGEPRKVPASGSTSATTSSY